MPRFMLRARLTPFYSGGGEKRQPRPRPVARLGTGDPPGSGLGRDCPQGLARSRALRLNMGVSDTVKAVLMDADLWESIETDEPERSGGVCVGPGFGNVGRNVGRARLLARHWWPRCFCGVPGDTGPA